jgi:hypothetical protein
MHFVWAGGGFPPAGAETVFAWHIRHPDYGLFIWFRDAATVQAARKTFAAYPTIHIRECDGSVRLGDGSVRNLLPAVQKGLLLPAVRGELLPAIQPAGLTMVETGAWGDGSVAPQGILIGLNRSSQSPNALIGLL